MDEDELRGLMLAVEVPPGSTDVRRAMKTGRRRNRGRALLAAGAGVTVFAVAGTFVATAPMRAGPADTGGAPGAAVTPPVKSNCVPQLLETPGGATGSVLAVGAGGTLAGGRLDGQPSQAVLWRDGKAVELPAGATGTVVDLAGDTVVGYAAARAGESTGWVWRDGKVTTLAAPSGYRWTDPSAVNPAGVVAGWAHGGADGGSVPVTWSADGTVHELRLPPLVGVPDTGTATARDISDDGTVGGEVDGIPVVWAPDGTPQTMPMAEGATTGIVWAVAGDYAYGSFGGFEVRWGLSVRSMLTLPDGGDLGARAGTADGTAVVAGDGLELWGLRIRRDGGMDRLQGPGGEKAIATAISPDGATVGGTVLDGERGRPAIWHCT